MTDATPDTPAFNPDEVEATRGREQGLGVGERELQAQRDPGRAFVEPDSPEANEEAFADDETLKRDTAVQGDQ